MSTFAHAADRMIEHVYPELTGDGQRDKVEIVVTDEGRLKVKFYINQGNYEFKLVSESGFMKSTKLEGVFLNEPYLTVNEKGQIQINQLFGSGGQRKLYLTHTFEFINDDLSLVEMQLTHFGGSLDTRRSTVDFKNKTETLSKIKKDDIFTKGKTQKRQDLEVIRLGDL